MTAEEAFAVVLAFGLIGLGALIGYGFAVTRRDPSYVPLPLAFKRRPSKLKLLGDRVVRLP